MKIKMNMAIVNCFNDSPLLYSTAQSVGQINLFLVLKIHLTILKLKILKSIKYMYVQH